MRLLPSQKDLFTSEIESVGLSPFHFDIKEEKNAVGGYVSTVYYKSNPEFSFTIKDGSLGYHLIKMCPGDQEYVSNNTVPSFDNVLKDFKSWATYMKREVNASNLWENMRTMVFNIGDHINDDKISYAEYEILTNKMYQLKEGIAKMSLPPAQIDFINAKLDQVLEQGKSSTKFNWISQLVGTIVTVTAALTLSPELGAKIWDLVKVLFSSNLLLP